MIWILACSLLLQLVCGKYSLPNVPDYLTEMSLQHLSHKPVNSKHYQLAMCITSDSNYTSQVVNNTISLMSLYQKKFSFRGLVFSPSPQMERLCNLLNIKVVKNISRNEYGVPFVRGMLETMKKLVHADYYGYMNSDILLNPEVFNTIPIINDNIRQGNLPSSVELISQVKAISYILTPQNNTYEEFSKYFHSIRYRGRMRDIYSADVFIFSNSFPLSDIPPVVVGRKCVDNVLIQIADKNQSAGVDVTPFMCSFHQGTTGYKKHGFHNQVKRDRYYNNKYVNGSLYSIMRLKYKLLREGILRKMH